MTESDEIYIDPGFRDVRVARLRDGKLVDFAISSLSRTTAVGSIVLGRVMRVAPQLNAAFVDIGAGKDGFLPAEAARPLAGVSNGQDREDISSLVHEGEAILVQIAADAVGTKGARLNGDISLAGRFVVFGPRRGDVAVSRKITEEAERSRLIEALNGDNGGFVVRTAAEGQDAAVLTSDAEALRRRWAEIEETAAAATAPAIIEAELDGLLRAVREADESGVKRVVVGHRGALARARSFAAKAFAGGGPLIDGHKSGRDLFEDIGIAAQLDELLEVRVALPGGGAITIETTEAMTTVDVDSAAIRGADKETNTLAVNLEAARETARQVRLRGIGGLIVIDFMRLDEPEQRQLVTAELRGALAQDRAATRFSRMDDFSLVAFTRRREGASLSAALLERCTACDGRGWRLSLAAAASAAYHEAEIQAQAGGPGALVVNVPPDVAATMNQGEADVAAFATRVGREVRVISDPQRDRDSVEAYVAEPDAVAGPGDFDGPDGFDDDDGPDGPDELME
jgi:ribonuclease G